MDLEIVPPTINPDNPSPQSNMGEIRLGSSWSGPIGPRGKGESFSVRLCIILGAEKLFGISDYC
jgi:hypothetical protein